MRSLFRKIREANRPFCTALVAAGGSSARMGTGRSKLLEQLDGIPVLAHTLRALEEAETVNAIVKEGMSASDALRYLMSRDRKSEMPQGYESV